MENTENSQEVLLSPLTDDEILTLVRGCTTPALEVLIKAMKTVKKDHSTQIDKFLTIIAYAYQIAGVHGAPDHILDVLSDPEEATTEQVDAMLPYQPDPPFSDMQYDMMRMAMQLIANGEILEPAKHAASILDAAKIEWLRKDSHTHAMPSPLASVSQPSGLMVCQEHDRECGEIPAGWCDSCPKRGAN